MKRVIIGMGIGILVGITSFFPAYFDFFRIPVLGHLMLAMQTPALILTQKVPLFANIHHGYVLIVIAGLVGALLGFLKPYKKLFILTIIGMVCLIGYTSFLFILDFAETMANF